MADLLLDLESMAANVEATANCHDIQLQDLQRWRRLFAYSQEQAKHEIENWRAKFDRLHVPDDLWEIVRDEKEREGYDREAYEYAMWHTASVKGRPASPTSASSSAKVSFILKLEGPLESAEKVQAVAQLADPPPTTVGAGEFDNASFCTIDSHTRQKILDWITASHPTFRPTLVRLSQSPKDLDKNSMAPALGYDPTLPQHRLGHHPNAQPDPAQDEYPVWYFFYGNLAKADELQQRLGLSEPPSYVPARVRGGKIRSWRGRYRALVDADASDVVDEGSAYLVASKEHEDVLRFYETEKYEVVRCDIEMERRVQKGLVFRFAGEDVELE